MNLPVRDFVNSWVWSQQRLRSNRGVRRLRGVAKLVRIIRENNSTLEWIYTTKYLEGTHWVLLRGTRHGELPLCARSLRGEGCVAVLLLSERVSNIERVSIFGIVENRNIFSSGTAGI